MGLSKEEQKEKYRSAGDVSYYPQPKINKTQPKVKFSKKIKRTKKDLRLISKYDKKKEPFNTLTQDRKKEVEPKTKKHKMVKFIDFKTVLNFGMYKGKKGKEVLKINKRYLLWMREENICKFSQNMHEALDF